MLRSSLYLLDQAFSTYKTHTDMALIFHNDSVLSLVGQQNKVVIQTVTIPKEDQSKDASEELAELDRVIKRNPKDAAL